MRKFVGAMSLILFSLAYYWLAISIAIVRLPGLATGWHLVFYFFTVVIWFLPAALIIKWAYAPRPAKRIAS